MSLICVFCRVKSRVNLKREVKMDKEMPLVGADNTHSYSTHTY